MFSAEFHSPSAQVAKGNQNCFLPRDAVGHPWYRGISAEKGVGFEESLEQGERDELSYPVFLIIRRVEV